MKVKKLKKRWISSLLAITMVLSLCIPQYTMTAKAEKDAPVNLAEGKEVILNDSVKGDQRAANPQVVTDGQAAIGWDTSFFVGVESDHKKDTYLTIDLGSSYDISNIKYFGLLPPDYNNGYINTSYNQVFLVSNDAEFQDESTKVVFNSDTDNFFGFGKGTDEAMESTLDGRAISFDTTNAQYVRYYQYGSKTKISGNYPTAMTVSEIQVYEENAPEDPEVLVPDGNVAYGAKVTGSEFNSQGKATNGWWGGWGNNDLQEITNGQANSDHWKTSTDNPDGDKGESVFVTLDLDKTREISTIKIWSKIGNTFSNQIVQVSENGQDWINVYNSDADNHAGQDPDDSEKLVCGDKLQNGIITGVPAENDGAYEESSAGKTIDFDTKNVRYIRWWSSGVPTNPNCMMIQLQAFNRHAVTFDYNDGTGKQNVVRVDDKTPVSRPENPISAVPGMLFDKWTVDTEGGEEWDFATEVKDNVKLVANWKQVGFSTVTFHTDGGTEIEPVQVTNGLAVAKPEDPQKEGKVFAGWKSNGEPYSFASPVTKDIILDATWILPAEPNAVTIPTGLLNIVLDSHGNVTNLNSTLDGTDYFNLEPDGKVRSLVSLLADYNMEVPTSVSYNSQANELTFGFASINAEAKVALVENGNYTSFTLTEVKKPESISLQSVLWGPIKTTIETGGQTVGTVYDDNYAIGMHMLNKKTIGGWPIECKDKYYAPDLDKVNGSADPRVTRCIYSNTATFSKWGSALQGYSWDYTKDTMRTTSNWSFSSQVDQMQPAMTGKYADELASMIGSSIAIYGTRTSNILNVISDIQTTEGLPHPTINGKWQKESIETGQDFLVFNDSIYGNVENDSEMANESGINYIYGQYGATGPWTSDGSFQFNGHFGGSDEAAKSMVDTAEKYNVKIGVHTLSNLISYHDVKATPEATDLLSYAGFSGLTRDASATDKTIYVKDGHPFSDAVVNVSGGKKEVRIGTEFLTYSQCTQVGENEWALTGCSRGDNGTAAAAHKADEKAYKLWFYYGSLVGGWESIEPVTDRLDEVMNNVGIHAMSYDSLESTRMSVYNTMLPAMYLETVYENNKKAGNADSFITEASDMYSSIWNVHSRISWGESNTDINTMINYLSYYRQNFYPAMIGWSYDHGNHGGYSEPNLLMNLAMKGGWNAGTGWYVNRNTFNQYPHMAEMLKTWNNAIQKGAFVVNEEFTEEVQAEMRAAWVNGKAWTLTETVPDKEWILQEVNKSSLKETIGDPITLTATNNINIDRDAINYGDVSTDVSLEYLREHSGNEVTVYTQAYDGYTLDADSLKVTGTDGTQCELVPVEGQDGVFTFVMPEQDVEITTEFAAGEEPVEPGTKETLKYFLDAAKEHVAKGDVEDCVESIKKLFAEAIEEGEKVMANENATKEEVINATVKLMYAIQSLDMKAGNKADLEKALKLTDMVDLTKYVEAGKEEYLAAKSAAEDVLADGDAMQKDIDEAWNALVDAMKQLRLKADKSVLKELLDCLKDLDLDQYTEESVTVYNKALAKANEVMEDERLSEDDQKLVDNTVKELADARKKLVSKDNSTGGDDNNNNGNTGDNGNKNDDKNTGNSENKGGNTPKTGDSMSVMLPIMFMLIAGGSIVMIMRKRRKEENQ